MTTAELEAKIYAAFVGDGALCAMLAGDNAGKAIYHLQSPSGSEARFPHIVYSPLNDMPALYGDDEELTHRVTERIHIVTKDGRYNEIYERVRIDMEAAGFLRVQTMPYISHDGWKVLVTDWKILTEK